jgi:hypothetical protein
MSSLKSFLPGGSSQVKASDPLDLFGKQASQKASDLQIAARDEGTRELKRQFDIQQSRLDPFFQQSAPAVNLLSQFSGAQGQEAQGAAFDQFNRSAGQDFLRKRGNKAALNAISRLGPQDQNVIDALNVEGGNVASQDFQNQLNRLASVAGIAQTTGAQLGSGNQQFATQFGQQQQTGTNAQLQNLQRQQQANQNAAGQGAQLLGSL